MKMIPVILAIVLFSCQKKTQNTEDTKTDAEVSTGTINTLSPEQLEDGWELLFDGHSLKGWHFYKNQPNNSWKVEAGILHALPFDSADQRADLVTDQIYKNFELQFDWRISYQGNSGVMFHVSEAFDQPYFTGPEYQIEDDAGYPGESSEKNKTGANFDMQAPENKVMNPQGEWNTSKLLVNGNHVEHWLNGKKVLSYELCSEEWKQQKANCKWKDVDSYGSLTEGYIDFQDHSSEVWFKNIMLRQL